MSELMGWLLDSDPALRWQVEWAAGRDSRMVEGARQADGTWLHPGRVWFEIDVGAKWLTFCAMRVLAWRGS